MANQEQLSILKQGVDVWNKWMEKNLGEAEINLSQANLRKAALSGANLTRANLWIANLREANLSNVHLNEANLQNTDLSKADLSGADLRGAILIQPVLKGARFSNVLLGGTVFSCRDFDKIIDIESAIHQGPSVISRGTISSTKGRIPDIFLRGCGWSDWEIESSKLHNPELSNDEINKILYKMYDLRGTQSIQISPLFISYSHSDSIFVDKLEDYLNKKGIRFWRDVHDAISGRLEKQIDLAIRQNPTVLLILSKHSIKSDWVEHEVRTARALEKEMGRDVLCPVALDDSWKNSPWSKRVMEQVTEYNILDFSAWKDDAKFEGTFNKLIDGLELFYK